MTHYNVLIATPGHSLVAGYVKSLLATIQVLEANNITWTYQNEYSSLVTNAREATIAGSRNVCVTSNQPGLGNFTYDKLFMIDSDIVWNPEQFMKLYSSDMSVVSGVYFESHNGDAVIHEHKDSYRMMTQQEIKYRFNTFPVYGVGFGFVCVKSGVFEDLGRPWFGLGKVQHEIDGTTYTLPLGEDLDWCERVAAKGHQVFVDPSVIVGHTKTMVI